MTQKNKSDRLLLAAIAAYYAGQGYCVDTGFKPPQCDAYVDVMAVMPRLREIKPRLKRGFAPAGIISYLLEEDTWVSVRLLALHTGYPYAEVGKMLDVAAEQGWVELDLAQDEPRCRLLDYQAPAREAIALFDGKHGFLEKIAAFESLQGSIHAGYFVFDGPVAAESSEYIVKRGAGILRYYERHGLFVEVVPAETLEITAPARYAMLCERVIYYMMFYKSDEIL